MAMPVSLSNALATKDSPEASSSTPPQPVCSVCNQQYAKYTCPRCSTRTCSAACSSSHKSKTGCTGQRNQVAYVPINKYTWGTMMDDYVFLEDMGRKVGSWGKEIARGGYSSANRGTGRNERGAGRGSWGRGGNRDGGRAGPGKSKRDILKIQLEARDIDMDLLAVGMDRRKMNQSTWDFKNQTALLTIEFKFYRPIDPFAPSTQLIDPPFILLTHRNNLKMTLLSLIRSHIAERSKSKKESVCPPWITELIHPDPDDVDSFSTPHCVMQTRLDPRTIQHKGMPRGKTYHPLDPAQIICSLLRHKQFVEFPTIEVWKEFKGNLVDENGIFTQLKEGRLQKRRKLNPKAGKAAIQGLLGGYGSEDDEEQNAPNVLTALADYAGSEDEGELSAGDQNLNDFEDRTAVDTDNLLSDKEEEEVDPELLLELLRQARDDVALALDDDEAVDWGDIEDDV